MKKTNKILSILITVAMMFSIATQAFAAVSLPSMSYIKCYTLNSSGKVYTYTDSSLKKKDKNHYISCSTDECKILKIQGNAVYVEYPLSSGGTRKAWFDRREFTGYNISGGADSSWVQANKITTYKRPGGASFGYISAGDVCYKLATSGGYTQCLYPVSNAYKMAWIYTSDISTQRKSNSNGGSGNLSSRINSFMNDSRWAIGSDWSNRRPYISPYSCSQCMAYAADFAKYVHNADSPKAGSKYTNINDIQVGDTIRVWRSGGYGHWMCCIGRSGNTVTVIHGNWTAGKACKSTFKISGNTLGSGSTFTEGYHFN